MKITKKAYINFRENKNCRQKWRRKQKCHEISEFQEANEV
jgi:hypothetical protein